MCVDRLSCTVGGLSDGFSLTSLYVPTTYSYIHVHVSLKVNMYTTYEMCGYTYMCTVLIKHQCTLAKKEVQKHVREVAQREFVCIGVACKGARATELSWTI